MPKNRHTPCNTFKVHMKEEHLVIIITSSHNFSYASLLQIWVINPFKYFYWRNIHISYFPCLLWVVFLLNVFATILGNCIIHGIAKNDLCCSVVNFCKLDIIAKIYFFMNEKFLPVFLSSCFSCSPKLLCYISHIFLSLLLKKKLRVTLTYISSFT